MAISEEVFAKVQETLVDALGVDDDEVTPEATLIGDLGAESIDFLDIVFRLEKNFDVKIPRGELFPEGLASADSGFIEDGVVTDKGISELRDPDASCRHRQVRRRSQGREHPGTVHGGDDLQVPSGQDQRLIRIARISQRSPTMRWFWIDRFLEFESGSYAKAVKNVSLAEEHLHDHFPGFAVMPGSLIIEGLAQTGGLLLSEATGFQHTVVLAKVGKMIFHSWACPGDTLTYSVTLIGCPRRRGTVEAMAHVGDRLVAEGEIMFAHADQMGADLPSGPISETTSSRPASSTF